MALAHKFIFWQNINSMHQSAFLDALSKEHEVVLVVTDTSTGREHMGWTDPVLERVRVLVFGQTDWKRFIDDNRGHDAWHVFAGLHAFPGVHAAFLYALHIGCRVGVYAEPLVIRGVAGMLKDLRGFSDGIRFREKIGFILCIGPEAKRQYLHWGFPPERLFSWAYVTEIESVPEPEPIHSDRVKAIFPASLIYRKGADILFRAVRQLKYADRFDLACYSVDPSSITSYQSKLMAEAAAGGIVRVHPFIDNRSLLQEMSTSDFMLLPSRFDGWGAVVNEALSVGTPVLVSEQCGASSVIRGNALLGRIIEALTPAGLATAMDAMIGKGQVGCDERLRIRAWTTTHLSGALLSAYFLRIVDAAGKGSRSVEPAPWEQTPQP